MEMETLRAFPIVTIKCPVQYILDEDLTEKHCQTALGPG
jgi:hypothetical protein